MKRIAIVMVLSIAVLTMSIAPASANEAEPPHCKDGHGKDCDPKPPECKDKCEEPKPPPPPLPTDNECVNGSCNNTNTNTLIHNPTPVISNPPANNYYVSAPAKSKKGKKHHKRHR